MTKQPSAIEDRGRAGWSFVARWCLVEYGKAEEEFMLDAWATTTISSAAAETHVPGDTAVEQHQSARPLSLLRRITTSDDELEAAQLCRAAAESGATRVDSCLRGQLIELYGRLRSVQHIPGWGLLSSPTVEAELFDGSGSVTLVWLGRAVILGIMAGRQLRVRGRIAMREGRRVMYNPNYALEASGS